MNILSFSYEVSQLYSKVVILSIGIDSKKYTVCVSMSFRKKNVSRPRGDLCWIHSSHPSENESFGSQEMDKVMRNAMPQTECKNEVPNPI